MAAPGGVEVGRVSVRVVPDTSHLFDDLKADLDRIEAESSINIRASVDSAKLVESARAAVSEAQALAGNIDVKTNVDTSQIAELDRAASTAGSALAGLASNFSVAGLGAAGFVIALGPVVAALAAVTAALAAPLAVVAGGVTIFGFLAGFAVKNTLAQIKQIDTAQKHLATLTKGTAAYNTAAAQLKALQDGLPASSRKFADALDLVKGVLNDPRIAGALLKPLTAGLKLLAAVIPPLTPVIKTVSRVLSGFVGQLNNAVRSPGFKGFVGAFAHQLGPDMKAFAKIGVNVLTGLFGLFGALNKQMSGGVLKSLVLITGKFADFGKSAGENKGLKSFVDYVKQALPPAGKIIGDAFSVIGGALGAVAPAALGLERLLAGVLDVLKKIGPIATPLAAVLAGIFVPFVGGPELGLILGLAAAIKEVYDRSKPLQQVIHDTGNYFTTVWLPRIKDAAQQVLPAFRAAVHDISQTIRQNKGLFETMGRLLGALAGVAIIGGIKTLVLAIRGIGKAFQLGTGALKLWADFELRYLAIVLRATAGFVTAVLSGFGRIVDGAALAFGWLPGIGAKVRAAKAAFDDFTKNIVGNLNTAANKLDGLRAQIDAVGNLHPKIGVTVDDLRAVQELQKLQEFRLRDKTLTIKVEQQIDRVVGPGGGIGVPLGANTGSPSGSSKAGPSSLVSVDKMYVSDVADMLRKTQKQFVSKAGGGVFLRPAPAFGGAR